VEDGGGVEDVGDIVEEDSEVIEGRHEVQSCHKRFWEVISVFSTKILSIT